METGCPTCVTAESLTATKGGMPSPFRVAVKVDTNENKLTTTLIVPVWVPVADGVKIALILHEDEGGKLAGQPFDIEKSPPGPMTDTPTVSLVKLLVRVTTCGPLEVPTTT
ncbi:MAG: hypothetical protein V9H25_19715 [Candidatus Competibacter sp.]